MKHYNSIPHKKNYHKTCLLQKRILTVIQILVSSLSFVSGSIQGASPRPVNNNIKSEKAVENFLVVRKPDMQYHRVIETSLGNSSLNLVSGPELWQFGKIKRS